MFDYRGFAINILSATDDKGERYFVYSIFKAMPLVSLRTNEHFVNASTALDFAKDFIDEHLVA